MTKKNGGKLRIEDLDDGAMETARALIHMVVASQQMPVDPQLGMMALRQILSGYWTGTNSLSAGLNAGLDAGLNAGLHAGLHDGLRAGLYAGLRAGLDAGLNAGLHAGLHDGLRAGLYAGLDAGLDAGLRAGLNDGLDDGLRDGLNDGLNDGLHAGLYAGLNDGLNAGLHAGLYAGLNDGLYAGLRAGLHDGLRAGLNDGLNDGLSAGLNDGLDAGLNAGLNDGLYAGLSAGLYAGLHDGNLTPCYCGVFWSWWLLRYAIANAWGCPLDARKLLLLRAFCLLSPIVGRLESDGKEVPVILPKPKMVRWKVTGKNSAPFEFPIYELHGNGQPSVEYWGLFNLYHWHNTAIPERMGTTLSEHWKPEWIVDEQNAEVRRILLQEIGYERAIKTLGATKVDTWREYELIRLTLPDMPVAYQLLKMTCPSTGDVHILRAPPDVKSAEAAITWCNHGNHPDDFVIQH